MLQVDQSRFNELFLSCRQYYEGKTGKPWTESFKHEAYHDDDHRAKLNRLSWSTSDGRIMFEQLKPFQNDTEYFVDLDSVQAFLAS